MSDSSNHTGPSIGPPHILVFDSGVGGLSVFKEIAALRPDIRLTYAADNEAFPYGTKTESELVARVSSVIRVLTDRLRPDILVIACNTASTTALDAVRQFLAIPVIGVVPAIKPAAAFSRARAIGLLGTNGTVASSYTRALIAEFAGDCRVVTCGAPELVEAAERKIQGMTSDIPAIRTVLARLFGAPYGDKIDTVVLGCTHFPLLRDELAQAAPHPVAWMDSGAAIARRVDTILGVANPDAQRSRNAQAFFTADTPAVARMRTGLESFGLTGIGFLQV